MAGARRLARVVYRSLLRASNNGENPEVFGEFGLSRLLLLHQQQNQHQKQHQNNKENHANTVSSVSSSLSSLSQIFPSNAHQVRHHLKSVFRGGGDEKKSGDPEKKNNDQQTKNDTDIMFPALRLSNELSSILYPKVFVQEHIQQQKRKKKRNKHSQQTQNQTQTRNEKTSIHDVDLTFSTEIPIFDFTPSSVLMGEHVRFQFFEPRYKLLAEKAMSSTDPHFQKMMILRGQILATEKEEEENHQKDSEPPTTESSSGRMRSRRLGSSTTVVDVSMLLKITEHTELPNGNVSVKCMGGPRIHVLKEEMVAVGHPDNHLAPLAQATEFVLGYDDENEEDDNNNCLPHKNDNENGSTDSVSNTSDTTPNTDDTNTQHDNDRHLLLLESLRNQCLELLLKSMVAQTKRRQQREPSPTLSPTQSSGDQQQQEEKEQMTQGVEERDDNDGNDDEEGENCEDEDVAILTSLLPSLVTLPPLDPERFSFWVLPFVIRPDDQTSRWWWLSCRSTMQRLQFVKFWLLENEGQ